MAVHKNDRQSFGFQVDASGLQGFIHDLKKASPVAARGLRATVKAAAEIVAAEARKNASAHSQSIPPTIKASTYLSGSKQSAATVTAGRGVPLAALYELGNKGKPESAATFRHPVFARGASGKLEQTEDWVDQARYPFLLPAAEATGAEVEAALETVADMVTDILARKL